MQIDKNKEWIFASLYEGQFYPNDIRVLEDLDNLEYVDVKEGEYQLWDPVTGDIYQIGIDREINQGKKFSVQYDNHGVVWRPVILKIDNNKVKVNEAYNLLKNSLNSV